MDKLEKKKHLKKYLKFCLFTWEKAARLWNINVVSLLNQLFLVYDKEVNNPLI